MLTGTPTVFWPVPISAPAPAARAAGGEVGLVRRHRTKPLIAAVGYAVGGGMELGAGV